MRLQQQIFWLIILGCTILTGSLAYGASYDNVQNTSVSDTFELSHEVSRVSSFKSTILSSAIQGTNTKIGRFIVRNNTMDGFRVSIESQYGGNLRPESTDDGESDIPYSISIAYSGELGEGVSQKTTLSTSELADEINILSTEQQSSPTDLTGVISIVVEDDSNQLSMSGTYSESLTIVFEDY